MFEASIVRHLMLTKTYDFVDETLLAAIAIDEHGDYCYFAINEQSKLLQATAWIYLAYNYKLYKSQGHNA